MCNVCRLEYVGGSKVDLDFVPMCNTALMLYGSSFISERAAGVSDFLAAASAGGDRGAGARKRPRDWLEGVASDERLLPVTRAIMAAAGVIMHVCVKAAMFESVLSDRRFLCVVHTNMARTCCPYKATCPGHVAL